MMEFWYTLEVAAQRRTEALTPNEKAKTITELGGRRDCGRVLESWRNFSWDAFHGRRSQRFLEVLIDDGKAQRNTHLRAICAEVLC